MSELIQALSIVVIAVLPFVAFDMIATRFGVDSRDRLPDDHRR